MSMKLTALSLHNFRNFPSYELVPSEGTTILVGNNAVGKTNLVEAMQLLTAGLSFRKPKTDELVRVGELSGKISARIEGDQRRVDVACEIKDSHRRFSRQNKACKASDIPGTLPSVLFCPDDLNMIKRSPSYRREALDGFGVQLNRQYASLISTYEKAIVQRNALLKDPSLSQDVLVAWDVSLCSVGAALVMHRLALLKRISHHLKEVYSYLAPLETVDVVYESTLGELDGCNKEEIAARMQSMLQASLSDDMRRGTTSVGPHRDELVFSINGFNARAFASQGQQRSIVLAWKIAEVKVTQDILGCYPLLLLDDVMSELDEIRRNAMMNFVGTDIQTIVTTTNLGYFSAEILDLAKVVQVNG